MTQSEPILAVQGISKRFGATQALSDVSFDVRPGEVHALMGENGAGKSTLMKIISGNYTPDEGEVRIAGSPVVMSSPRDAMAAGVGIIHQELNTLPEMTVAENLAIGKEPVTALGVLDRRTMIRDAREKLERVGATRIDPRRPIGTLSVGMQQMVEIARAVAEDVKVLVLDEPTAALSMAESERLFELINEMRDKGMGLIYISHRMEEVWQLADRVTVFRDGKLVGTRDMRDEAAKVTPNDIVKMMVGRDVEDLYGHREDHAEQVRLSVRSLTGPGGIGPVDFDVRAGEIVTMAGLIGAGRTEVARLLYGADRRTGGTVTLDDLPVTARNPREAVAAGIGMLPESRKDQALFLDMSVRDNTAMSTLKQFSPAGVINFAKMRQAVAEVFTQLRVKAASQGVDSRSLSGGNQQKLVLGRLMLEHPALMILDEPTRGVDIGAKSEIYRIINEIAASGTAVLVISSDLPEALGISDRILVMRNGQIVGELDGPSATEERVMEFATGVFADDTTRNQS